VNLNVTAIESTDDAFAVTLELSKERKKVDAN